MQYYEKNIIIVFKVNEDTKFVVDIRYMFDFNWNVNVCNIT